MARHGSALLSCGGLLEVVLRERPTPDGAMPKVHGLVKPNNDPASRSFKTVLFEPHELESEEREEWQETASGLTIPVKVPMPKDVTVVRQPGQPLPEDRDFDAYRPVLGAEFFASFESSDQLARNR
jgi:hypothetical protein